MALSPGQAAVTVPALYRTLLRTCASVDPALYGHEHNNLCEWAATRFRSESAVLRRRIALCKGREGDDPGADYEGALQAAADAELRCRRLVDAVEAARHMEPGDNPAVVSCFAAAQYNAGSLTYQRSVEDGFLMLADFGERFAARREEEEVRGNQTKNRAMQVAVRGFARVLCALDRAGHGAAAAGWQRELSEHAPANSWFFYELPELVALETDPVRRRHTIYIRSPVDLREQPRRTRAEAQEWQLEPAGVHFEQDAHLSALRVLGQLRQDQRLDPSYGVALAGHSMGGAAGVVLAAYLASDQFSIRNVITFGQPMVTTTVACAPLSELPILRVTAPVDAYVDTPEGSAPRILYLHYGEELSIMPQLLKDQPDEYLQQNRVYVTMAEYADLVNDDTAVLTYRASPAPAPHHGGQEDLADGTDDRSEYAKSRWAPNRRKIKKRKR
eukprot:TRINITY_DN50197_c0_g1_i1.p1 TRINITY_DN50197_c0_g1~~TRINITY_DN50197_c0_g1_i1.p1  ORF type:complete len:444 (+),score=160.58 TRINITY_DN50197_c0_g1_i1:79-1410(+)